MVKNPGTSVTRLTPQRKNTLAGTPFSFDKRLCFLYQLPKCFVIESGHQRFGAACPDRGTRMVLMMFG
jgi:hypothetical protein